MPYPYPQNKLEQISDGWEQVKGKRPKNRKSIEKLLVEDEANKDVEKDLDELDDVTLFEGKTSAGMAMTLYFNCFRICLATMGFVVCTCVQIIKSSSRSFYLFAW